MHSDVQEHHFTRTWQFVSLLGSCRFQLDCVWNVMAHAQKADFVFRKNGWVHLNRRGHQFSRLLAAEVCASAVVMLDTPCSEVVWRALNGYPLHSPVSPSLPLPCVTVWHQVSTGLYHKQSRIRCYFQRPSTPFSSMSLLQYIAFPLKHKGGGRFPSARTHASHRTRSLHVEVSYATRADGKWLPTVVC